MSSVPVRDLRNHTAEVVRRAQAGERVTITVNGNPVATLAAVERVEQAYLTKDELLAMRPAAPDVDLDRHIRELTSETTDDLGPIE